MRKSLLFLALLVTATAHAGMWGSRGVSRRFLANGDRLYVADGRGVSLYDVSNPANIQRLDVEISDTETRDLAFAGSDMLVVATKGGIDRFAVASDGTLSRLESIPVAGGAAHVAGDATRIAAITSTGLTIYERGGTRIAEISISKTVNALLSIGSYLYVAVDREGIYFYDGSSTEPDGYVAVDARDLSRSGNTLWAAAGASGIAAIDVTNPAAPRILTYAGAGEVNMTRIAAGASRVFAGQGADTIFAFDTSAVSAPRLLATLHDATAEVIGASGTKLFTAGTLIDAYGSITETGVAVRAYDATNLTAVREAGTFTDTLSGPVSGAATDGTLAYIVDRPYFRVLDVSNSDTPRVLASLEIPDIQDRIRVRDGRALIYGRGDVNILDITDPYAPKLLGTYKSTGHPLSNASFARDTFVEANFHSGMHVVDYSDPAHPVQIAGRIWHYNDLVTSDDAIYAFTYNEMLVADLTDRRKVKDVSIGTINFRQAETAPAQAAAPDWLVLRTTGGFSLRSLTENRFAPRETAFINEPAAGIFGTSATHAYFDKDNHLTAIELATATETDTGLPVTAPMQIAAAGDKIVVADEYSVRVYGPQTAPPPPPPSSPKPTRRRAAGH
ncbi:MAG TPA: hypothetical protein VFN10_04530 [Thermoanaerobaculia bacterium]|nr:hypothetical protein [Thermoanaerobaculia bacterium]